MPKAMDTISFAATAPGATITASTAATGDSFAIRSAPFDKKVWLLDVWGFWGTTTGLLRIRSPRLHDNVQGIRFRMTSANAEPLYPSVANKGFKQFLIPQDTLIVEQTGTAVGGAIDSGSLLAFYEDLPAISGRFITNDDLKAFGVNIIGQEMSITTGTTIAYTGQVAINVTNDNFKANTDYALLGGMVDTRLATVAVRGVDTGNLRVSFPGEPTQRHVTSNFFQRLALSMDLPLIPVFNSANKAAILVDGIGNAAAITSVVTLFMVELQPGKVPGAVAVVPS